MISTRRILSYATLVSLFVASGAACPTMMRRPDPLPRVLSPNPSLDQVIQAVNANSQQIANFSSNQASVSGSGFPTLRATLAFERPKRFRLRADHTLTGPELDVGSNDELFWFWVRREQPPTVFFCRHDQWPTSPNRQMVPVEPEWLIEALGIVEFEPTLPHQGPFAMQGNRLEIRTVRETAQGPQTKITIVDAASATVLEQRIYNCQGRLVASAAESGHRRDPLTGLIMPGTVQLQSAAAQMNVRIDLGNVQINRPYGSPEMWQMPQYPQTALVDLGTSAVPQPVLVPSAVGTSPSAARAEPRRRY